MSKKMKLPSLEESLNEITSLIEEMEKQNLSLENSLQHFEKGVSLIKHCQSILKEAEQKVSILIQNKGKDELAPYESASE